MIDWVFNYQFDNSEFEIWIKSYNRLRLLLQPLKIDSNSSSSSAEEKDDTYDDNVGGLKIGKQKISTGAESNGISDVTINELEVMQW